MATIGRVLLVTTSSCFSSCHVRFRLTEGSVQHLLLSVGGQWDVVPAFTVGALVRAAGLRIGGRAGADLRDRVRRSRDQSDLTFRDRQARFDFTGLYSIWFVFYHALADGRVAGREAA